MTLLKSWTAPANTGEQAKRNISAHYDVSNEMFAAFLSPDMTYSSTQAPYHIKAARIEPSDHVLEIGTGWGSFAIQAVRETGCTLTSVTLSAEQKALAEKRIEAAGLADKITVLLCDYRDIPNLGLRFDKIVSIEMLEHTGIEHLAEYFGVIKDLLTGQGAIASLQATLMSESIFPGGYLPTLTQTVEAINKGAGDHFIIDRVEAFDGLAKTFQIWRETFDREFEAVIRPGLLAKIPQLCEADVETFRRKWRASFCRRKLRIMLIFAQYYFAYCQAGFEAQVLRTVTLRLVRNGTPIVAQDCFM
ncbi:cyclopropane-fatty-acyl-phospholipid synthase [Purpureocillium lavendulum]|uniref:Cyclopropane-fatty-acyl-phospholipid synthase n=1 Tax=Purpureocillium lavendulum TaxID=1247861 RepID=A0AB34FXD2_9HYPO|nr:cyclopropane-fatty-acyl-phospholipid synthase [Purpureocillium lavendulum]